MGRLCAQSIRSALLILAGVCMLPVARPFSTSPPVSLFGPVASSASCARRRLQTPRMGVHLRNGGLALRMNEVKEAPAGSDPISVVKGQADTMSKFMEKLNEYKACKDKEQRKAMQREIIGMYVEFAVPAVALALGTLLSFPGAFVFFYVFLGVTGRGLPDMEAIFASFPEFIAGPASELFEKVDPNIGNAAVAAILVELASPLLFILSATMKGKIEGWLNAKLPEWGVDAAGLTARLERIAGPDEPLF